MATSQKEFIVGCFLGGLLGASAALLVHKKFLNGTKGVTHKVSKNTRHKAKVRASVKRFAVKKSKLRKSVKRAVKK